MDRNEMTVTDSQIQHEWHILYNLLFYIILNSKYTPKTGYILLVAVKKYNNRNRNTECTIVHFKGKIWYYY